MFKRAMSLCAYCDWGLRLFVVTFLIPVSMVGYRVDVHVDMCLGTQEHVLAVQRELL